MKRQRIPPKAAINTNRDLINNPERENRISKHNDLYEFNGAINYGEVYLRAGFMVLVLGTQSHKHKQDLTCKVANVHH